MKDILEIVKRKKIEKMILSFILLIFCFLNITLNIDSYRSVLYKKYIHVDNINKLEDAYKNNNRFITMDLKKAKKENYLVEYKKEKANIYTLKLENINVLLLIKDNTILTNKTNMEIIPNNEIIKDIKDKFKDNDYYEVSLSNMDWQLDYNFELYKLYVMFILFGLSVLSSIIYIIQVLNPEKTSMYKKYIKKYNINK